MRYCEYCGTPQDDDALFCTNCGQRLSTVEQPLQSSAMELPAAEDALEETDASSAVEATTIEEVTPADAVIYENDDEEEISWLRQNKQWLIPAGVVALLAMIATGVYFLFFKAENNPLGIEKPKWEKFVTVTEEYAYIYKEADSSSPKLMSLTENSTEEGCYILETKYRWADEGEMRGYTRSEFHQEGNAIMPVIAEEKKWYLVQIETWEGIVLKGYISKNDCKEVKPTPITQEVLNKLDEESKGQRCDHVVTKGKYKNLCLTSECYEVEGDQGKNLSIGQLTDGILLYPDHDWVDIENNGASTIALTKAANDNFYQLTCGDKHLYNPEGRQDEWMDLFLALDTHQLSNELIDDLVKTLKPDHTDKVKAVYYFPGIDEYKELHSFTYSPQSLKDSDAVTDASNEDEGIIHITGYSIRMKNEYEQEVIAELDNGTYENTGFIFDTGITPIIAEMGDYDADGEMEAVIQEQRSGTNGKPYIISYDKYAKQYIRKGFSFAAIGICPTDSHPHMIDLGLPSGTKWYCSNFKASKPDDEGEIINYTQVDGNTSLPTEEEANELAMSCTSKPFLNGLLLTGPNGRRIFFPNNHIWIPEWYDGETGLRQHSSPLLWTSSFEGATSEGIRVWFWVYEPGKKINGYGGNEVKYAARYVSR